MEVTGRAMNSLTKFEQAKELYRAGRTSWAVNLIEQEVLDDKYASLSDDDKDMIHVWLYEGGLKDSKTQDDLFDSIDEMLDRDMSVEV